MNLTWEEQPVTCWAEGIPAVSWEVGKPGSLLTGPFPAAGPQTVLQAEAFRREHMDLLQVQNVSVTVQ